MFTVHWNVAYTFLQEKYCWPLNHYSRFLMFLRFFKVTTLNFESNSSARLVITWCHTLWVPSYQTGLEKYGCHAMVLPWSCYDHGETWSWSCYDGSMAAIFFDIFAMNHGIIMVWLPYSPWFIPWSWYDHHVFHDFWIVLSIFPQIIAAIFHHMAHLNVLRENYSTKPPSQQN